MNLEQHAEDQKKKRFHSLSLSTDALVDALTGLIPVRWIRLPKLLCAPFWQIWVAFAGLAGGPTPGLAASLCFFSSLKPSQTFTRFPQEPNASPTFRNLLPRISWCVCLCAYLNPQSSTWYSSSKANPAPGTRPTHELFFFFFLPFPSSLPFLAHALTSLPTLELLHAILDVFSCFASHD